MGKKENSVSVGINLAVKLAIAQLGLAMDIHVRVYVCRILCKSEHAWLLRHQAICSNHNIYSRYVPVFLTCIFW